MLAGFDRNDVAEEPVGLHLAQVDIERGVAQHEADHDVVGTILMDELSQRHGLGDRRHHRLFGEDLAAGFEPGANVAEMHVIGRPDHQQVEPFGGQHAFERVVMLAGGDAVLLGIGEPERFGIDVGNDGEVIAERG